MRYFIFPILLGIVFLSNYATANAEVPIPPPRPIMLESPFNGIPKPDANGLIELYGNDEFPQHYCLALNIYFEARGSNLADKAGVANVVMNRTQDRRFPDTICDVVTQGNTDSNGNPKRNQCQFSWYCDGESDVPTDTDRWIEAQMLAYLMIEEGKFRGLTEGATHYHASYVKPYWAKEFQLVGRIGEHIFYRWEN